MQCADLFGPARILAVDMVPERLARAERLGAEPIDARQAPGLRQVLEATGGRGAESVIEAVGADATVVDAVLCAAPGGTVSIVGVNLTMDLPFPMGLVFLKSLTLRAIFAPIPGTWAALVPLVQAGRFALAETFTHHMGLSQARRGLRALRLAGRRGPEGPARPEELSPLGLLGCPVAHGGPLGVAQLGAGHEPWRRRRHDQRGQGVDDGLVVDPPPLEVAPRLVGVALEREVHLLEARYPSLNSARVSRIPAVGSGSVS